MAGAAFAGKMFEAEGAERYKRCFAQRHTFILDNSEAAFDRLSMRGDSSAGGNHSRGGDEAAARRVGRLRGAFIEGYVSGVRALAG